MTLGYAEHIVPFTRLESIDPKRQDNRSKPYYRKQNYPFQRADGCRFRRYRRTFAGFPQKPLTIGDTQDHTAYDRDQPIHGKRCGRVGVQRTEKGSEQFEEAEGGNDVDRHRNQSDDYRVFLQ